MSYENDHTRDIFKKLQRYDVDDETGCWNWNGHISQRGYGTVRFNGKLYYIHRLVAELFIRPLEKDEVVHHMCENQVCINPDHLDILVHGDHSSKHMKEYWKKWRETQ